MAEQFLYSPWLVELDGRREKQQLTKNMQTAVVVVGAGVSGMLTALELVCTTGLRVTVFDPSLT